jgi:predicted glycoside hydrolase/deacetylase ChbG (UPF0249 family)
VTEPAGVPLLERLGRPVNCRAVILTGAELGLCHAANLGVYQALRSGSATSARIMVPCPWAREAAGRYRGEDVGVALTLNSEHPRYRWGPVTGSPSLLDGDGGMPREVADLWDHADPEEVARECRAQLERAIHWGMGISHLGCHREAMVMRPELFGALIDLALEFSLPVSLPDSTHEAAAGFPFRKVAAESGIPFPDHRRAVSGLEELEGALSSLEDGVTELVMRPAAPTPELEALAEDWADRVADFRALSFATDWLERAKRSRISFIGFRELGRLIRS